MNERLTQLEIQATETVKCGLNGTSTAEVFNRKKFAELIVRECADIVAGSSLPDSYSEPCLEVIADEMKEWFGVDID